MSANDERQFQEAMDALHFSSGDKERLCRKIVRAQQKNAEREVASMKKWTLGNVAAVAVLLVLTCGFVYAASTITTTSSSSSHEDYKYSYDQIGKAMEKAGIDADIPEDLGAGYHFGKAAVLEIRGSDADGHTVKKWPSIDVQYAGAGGARLSLSIEDNANVLEGGREASQTREINGVTVEYNLDEYVFLPPDAEEGGLSAEMRERLDSDPHFYVSYGTAEEEHGYFSSAAFVKDGVHYLLYAHDTPLDAEDFFEMSEVILGMD